MASPYSRPVLVLVPGAAQSPSHYAHLLYLLQSKGYATFSAPLPSTGPANGDPVSVDDDATYVRSRMLLPILDVEKHNVVLIMPSYSGLPGSAAAQGLSKSEREAEGKSTSVLGQIYIAAIVTKGGDGKNVKDTFGGQYPPHIQVDVRIPFGHFLQHLPAANASCPIIPLYSLASER